MLPFVGGLIVVSMIAFMLYVRSVPPRVPAQPVTPATPENFMQYETASSADGTSGDENVEAPKGVAEAEVQEEKAEETIEL